MTGTPDQAAPIIASVCHEFGILADDLRGSTRKHAVSTPRKLLMYILHREQGWTLQSIGALLARHHSTIIYGVRDTEHRLRESVAMQASLERITLGATQ